MAKKPVVQPPKEVAEVRPPEKMIIAGILSTFEGRLESFLADKFAKGYALSCSPTFVGKMAPYGMNEYAVGYHHHFLVILQKLPPTPTS